MSDKITAALNFMKSRILNSFMFTRREISPNYETHTSREGKKAQPMGKYKLSHDTLHQVIDIGAKGNIGSLLILEVTISNKEDKLW